MPHLSTFRPHKSAGFLIIAWLLTLSAVAAGAARPDVPNPYPRLVVLGDVIKRWDFDSDAGGWQAAHACGFAVTDSTLKVTATGHDPYLTVPLAAPRGNLVLRVRLKSTGAGAGQFFWSTGASGGFSPVNQRNFVLVHDGQWHEHQVMIRVDQPLTALRLDPGQDAGEMEIDWIEVRGGGLHPIEIEAVEAGGQELVAHIHNHADEAIDARVSGVATTLPPGQTTTATIRLATATPLESVTVTVDAAPLPPLHRSAWIYHPDAAIDAVRLAGPAMTVEVAHNGSVVRLMRQGQTVAALAPLVHHEGTLPKLKLAGENWPLRLTGDGLTVVLDLAPTGELRVRIESGRPVEGPVVRVFGALEQGLFSGVEYLGQGERSSSKLDIETSEHLRVEPDPMKVTMPLMACVTDRACVALAWNDMALQPVFAVPNFLDGTPDHRLALKGDSIDAVLRVGPGWRDGGRLEEMILWDVKRRGLPDLPPRPRSSEAQTALSLAAYRGMVFDPENEGWFHAVVPGVRRSPSRGAYFADHVSAIWRMTGSAPQVPSLAHGGSHVRNPAAYFVTGRASDWLRVVNRRAAALIQQQRPDGSYRYGGEYRRGHFEDTASGICARPAYELLEHAYYTGDEKSLQAGLKTLAYMKRFRTPRGAQTWEVPLHTPDILASAHLVWAYVRGYELTGDEQWLAEARRWAITGVPFVYQWSNQPIMDYATTPVLGATHWRAPNWIGLPVQWCGTVYAYALLLLAPYDKTLDWHQVAEGILLCGEQMQYPDGPSVGCLPDVFALRSQKRMPADINPGALVSLRWLIDGRLDALARAREGGHLVVAPLPVTIRDGKAVVQGQAGVAYEVLIDGRRIVAVSSRGEDVIELD